MHGVAIGSPAISGGGSGIGAKEVILGLGILAIGLKLFSPGVFDKISSPRFWGVDI